MEVQSKTMKGNQVLQLIHRVPAGALPADRSIELFADRDTRRVFFMSSGRTHPFRSLPPKVKMNIFQLLRSDKVAMNDLRKLSYNEALERYAYCMFGTLDSTADFNEGGSMGQPDNFICGIEGCNCKNWERKHVLYNGRVIQGRILEVLLAYGKGLDDRNVADRLGIGLSTLYSHKKRLFGIFQVFSKTEMVVSAIEAKIIQ